MSATPISAGFARPLPNGAYGRPGSRVVRFVRGRAMQVAGGTEPGSGPGRGPQIGRSGESAGKDSETWLWGQNE